MTTTRSAGGRARAGPGSLAVTACSSAAGPHDTAYTFHRDDSGIKVDTPALRALKASTEVVSLPGDRSRRVASTEDCPT